MKFLHLNKYTLAFYASSSIIKDKEIVLEDEINP